MEQSGSKPRIALAPGDPAGIGPGLTARLLADPACTVSPNLWVIRGRWTLAQGSHVAEADFGGALPADTAFLCACKSASTAVLMVHQDQSRIATTLLGAFRPRSVPRGTALTESSPIRIPTAPRCGLLPA